MNIIESLHEKKVSPHVANAREIYSIAQWSEGFFDINDEGNVVAYPNGRRDGKGIELKQLIDQIYNKGLCLPVLVRFTDILKKRLDDLHKAFQNAIAENKYYAKYTCVYPIKVNQQRRVVEKIIKQGDKYVGLEAGSKPELMAVLALTHPGSIVVCNGYKDREYIRLALIGQKLDKVVYIILEKLSELDLVLDEAQKLNIEPKLGIRIRLATKTAGKWQNSGGEKSKFGFSAAQVLYVITHLKKIHCEHYLQLLHFHLGSQIANITDIQRGLKECARFYAELHSMGFNIHTVDVGGGLSVDYDGTHSRNFCSMNYTLQEYANNIVYTLLETCQAHDIPHPNIITESGRSLTAHHAVLITDIIDVETVEQNEKIQPVTTHDHQILQNLWDGLNTVTPRSAVEVYHDACYWMQEAHSMFTLGILDLAERARVEQLYYSICCKVRGLLSHTIRPHRQVLDELNEKLADKFFCNFSLFQSLPDAWAIDQVFPILPLSDLNQPLKRRGIIEDITCDSDGCVDFYVNNQGLESTLPLLPYNNNLYPLGIFLVGSYQEILGDMHNLFGDTHSVHIELNASGSYDLVEPVMGDSVDTVLRYVQFEPNILLDAYEQQVNAADLTEAERQEFLQTLTIGLHGYTYLEE